MKKDEPRRESYQMKSEHGKKNSGNEIKKSQRPTSRLHTPKDANGQLATSTQWVNA